MKSGFGWVEIDGRTYQNDVVLHVDGKVTKRKKKLSRALKGEYGHTPLSEVELGQVAGEQPEVVFIGTGQDEAMPITPGARAILDRYPSVVGSTPKLLARLSREKRRKIAILHVTC